MRSHPREGLSPVRSQEFEFQIQRWSWTPPKWFERVDAERLGSESPGVGEAQLVEVWNGMGSPWKRV
jgi:hypothetical protein